MCFRENILKLKLEKKQIAVVCFFYKKKVGSIISKKSFFTYYLI